MQRNAKRVWHVSWWNANSAAKVLSRPVEGMRCSRRGYYNKYAKAPLGYLSPLVDVFGREPAEVPEGAVAAVALQRLAIVLHRGVPVAVARAPARPKRARASWS